MELLLFMTEFDPDEHVYAAGSQADIAYRRSDNICPLQVDSDRDMDDLEKVGPYHIELVQIGGVQAAAMANTQVCALVNDLCYVI